MRKAIYIIIACMFSHCLFAQDSTVRRLNIKASYSIGMQTFRLNGLETLIDAQLKDNTPNSTRTENVSFSPTLVNRVSLSASIFNNKKWFLHLDGIWGSNSLIAYGYSTDANGNPYKATGKADFNFIYTGQGLSREFDLKKWGKLSPYLGFYLYWKTAFKLKINYEIRNKTTNDIIKTGSEAGGSDNPYRYGSPYIFLLFDNPKLGLNYEIKIMNHAYFHIDYSYWFGNSYINELYSNTGYILKPTKGRRTTKDNEFHKDLYSHNISAGLTFKLLK
jgi:hypothetical protein